MYADLYLSTNPAAAAPPSELEPVQYADIKKPVKQQSHYADLYHSTNPPAPSLPVEPV